MNKKQFFIEAVILAFAVLFTTILIVQNSQNIDATTESSTVSNATVAVTIGFTFSSNMTAGILYGSVNAGSNDNNASGNNNQNWSDVGCTGSNCTAYWINFDSANNIGSDTCIKDNANLTVSGGSTTIPNSGYTYDMNITANGSNMNSATGSTAITNAYVLAGSTNINATQNQTMQFYLDVPASQPAGTYNNTISIKIVQTGAGC